MNDSYSDGPPIGVMIFALAIIVLIFASMWKVFVKAGKPGWAALIPFYNVYTLTKIVGKPGWWTLLFLFVPFMNIWLYNLTAKSFGKTEAFTVGLVLLGIVFWPILGFGDARYLGPSAQEAGGLQPATDLGDGILDS